MKYGNHVSIDKNTDKSLKAMNKDEKNNYIIPFPKILTRFIPNLQLTPHDLLIKPGKTIVQSGTERSPYIIIQNILI